MVLEAKKVGIVGGIGPASTLEYYKSIIEECRKRKQTEDYPEIFIDSINMTQMLSYLASNQRDKLIAQIVFSIEHLAAGGAEIAAIASNTPHIVFNEISRKSPIPVISIVETVCRHVQQHEYKRVLILGTKFTMMNGLYTNALKKIGVEGIVPGAEDIETIDNIIFPNLENGIVLPDEKKKIQKLVNKVAKANKVDAVILGCTELPLILKDGDLNVPIVNSTLVHIEEIINYMLY